jgi:molecular chaperone HtpG
MPNFGIADRLEVISESGVIPERTRCIAERKTLSVTDDCINFFREEVTGSSGSVVIATMQEGQQIDVNKAVSYITEFVRFVDLPVNVNGKIVSQLPFHQAVGMLFESWRWEDQKVALSQNLVADVNLIGSGSGEVRVDLTNISYNNREIVGRLVLKQGVSGIQTFRNRFGLATTSIPSVYQLGGVADFLLLQPTAGREALTTESVAFLNQFGAPIDALISQHLANHPEANNSQAFINWVAAHKQWKMCGQLRARIQPGDSAVLSELAELSKTKPLLVYSGNDPATMEHASIERPVVQLARNAQRRQCEHGYLSQYGKIESLTDDPKILHRHDSSELSLAQSALIFRLTEILNSDYFLSTDVGFGTISHGLPILVNGPNPVMITLDPSASNVGVLLQVYEKEFGVFGHIAKDFVRNVIFPKISHLVPSATKQGTEAFLKTLQRTRDVFEYERSDLENLTSLWTDYLNDKISKEQATLKLKAVRRSYQTLNPDSSGRFRDIVPDLAEGTLHSVGGDCADDRAGEANASDDGPPNFDAMPPIQRSDISTDRKLLIIDETDPPLKSFRCFLAISNRVYEERGEFFLQPHRTSIVWGGQKALFIFEHHSGEVGLYYDVQTKEPVSSSSGGGSFETCTIIMRNQIFIPVPHPIQDTFMPKIGETKRLEVRCDLLYIDVNR